jgi:glycerophosphoryl diester phosphodiesterase
MTEPKYVAHRGYSMMAPENTIPSFELAGVSGFWGIECDTYCTVDGRWIVHHDRTVDRMTDGTGKAKDFTFDDIRKLNIVSGSNIGNYPGLFVPTLEEVLEVCKKYNMQALVEIEHYHTDADLESLLGIIKNSGMFEQCCFICFNADDLRKMRKLNNDVTLGYLSAKRPSLEDIEFVKELGNAFLDYSYEETTVKDIKRCHEAGIEVSVWTVNTKEEAGLFIKAGVDYITTDTMLK